MLVLSRKVGETVVIGEEIRVTVLEIRGNSIKLGLSAPQEVAIRRAELPVDNRPGRNTDILAAPVVSPGTFIIEAAIG